MSEPHGKRQLALRVGGSLLLAFGQTAASIAWLRADGPIGLMYAYVACVETLTLLRLLLHRLPPLGRRGAGLRTVEGVTTVLLGLLFLFGALVILVGLNITPVSAYLAWFGLVREGVRGGTLAYMFSVKFAYFGALFASLLIGGSVLSALLNLSAVDLLILAVLLDKPGLAAIGALLFLAALVRLATRRAGRLKGRARAAVAQVALLSAVVALPFWALHPRNRIIDDLYAIRMERLVASIFPNFPFLYNVPGYGYTLESGQIGDAPALTSRPVFQLTAPAGSTVYIRTGVYDVYTGTGWELSDGGTQVGANSVPFFETLAAARLQPQTRPITFKVLIDFYSSLPHTLGTVAFRFPDAPTPDATFANLGSGFILYAPLRRGSTIVDLVASPNDALKPIDLAFRRRGRREEDPSSTKPFAASLFSHRSKQDAAGGEDGGNAAASADDPPSENATAEDGGYDEWWGDSWNPTSYFRLVRRRLEDLQDAYGLQLGRYALTPWERDADLQTGAVPESLLQLARRLGAGESQGETIDAIRSYLLDNYGYTLQTKPGGPYDDAVSNFLFSTKKGYCVQFASAFVILARLNGIPARYVTGFLAELPSNSTEMVVTGLSAHAWAEVWDNERGWITEEATPPMLAAAAGSPHVLQEYNPTDSRYTQRQLEAVLGGRLTPSAPPTLAPQPALTQQLSGITKHVTSHGSLIPLSIALLVLIVGLVLRRLVRREDRFRQVVRRIARHASARGYPDPAQAGWQGWSRALAVRFPDRSDVARRAALVIQRSFFSPPSATPGRDLDFLRRLERALRAGRRRAVGGPRSGRRAP